MSKKLTLGLALLAAISGFSNELTIPSQQVLLPTMNIGSREAFSKYDSTKLEPARKASVYFRAMTDTQPDQATEIIPGYGLGYRRSFGDDAVDCSVNYSTGEGNRHYTFWTAPKVTYLRYFAPAKDQSLYAGLGLAWGGTQSVIKSEMNLDDDELPAGTISSRSGFIGLIPHVTVGYEFLRHSMIFSFTELTVSQPLIPSQSIGPKPGPVGEISIGAGY